PRLAYRGLASGLELGAFVKERDAGADVREVILENPTDLPVLLYEGEHISGAQQNRSVDASLLVPAKSAVEVPVSCIERGRWDGDRHHEPFTRSRYTADPELRAIKRADANRRADGRPDQGRVW